MVRATTLGQFHMVPADLWDQSTVLLICSAATIITLIALSHIVFRVPQRPASKDPKCWRINNVAEHEKDELQKKLSEQQTLFSLARETTTSWCATVTSIDRPKDVRATWHISSDFLGITPLVSPDNATVDIVVVPGLGGHPMGSFRSQSDKISIWFRDFLPKQMPDARVLTYGYESGVATSRSKQSISEIARDLLQKLYAFRFNTKTQNRAICFVGHSLGGVVLKEALAISESAADDGYSDLRGIFVSTHGLFLFGVPNLGLRHDTLLTIAKGNPNEELMRSLSVDTDSEPTSYLRNLTERFIHTCRRQDPSFRIFTYFERVPSPQIVKISNGRPTYSKESRIMVTRESAERVSKEISNVGSMPRNTDHRGLVRFDNPSDSDYIAFQQSLIDVATSAPQEVNKRLRSIQDLTDDQSRAWRDMNMPRYESYRYGKSLKWEGGTLSWLLSADDTQNEHSWFEDSHLTGHDFAGWRDSKDSSCLLMYAGPGSGKSVISNFVVSHLESQATAATDMKVIHFFCSFNDSPDVGTPEAVLRALILQLCENSRKTFEQIPESFQRRPNDFKAAALRNLWGIFIDMFKTSPHTRVFCVIDGLDVYGDRMVDLIERLNDMLEEPETIPSGRVFKLFCTTRPETVFLHPWTNAMRRRFQTRQEDLDVYTESRLGQLKRLKQEFMDHAKTIIRNKRGCTFLWISIVFRRLKEANLLTKNTVESIVNELPLQLFDLFKLLVSRAIKADRRNARIIAWIAYAFDPLRLKFLSVAVAIDPHKEYESLEQLKDDMPDLEKEGGILHSLGTLVDVTAGYHSLIHQSLRDYLRQERPLDDELGSTSHIYLAKACLQYRRSYRNGHIDWRSDWAYEHGDFPRYASTWYEHIQGVTESLEILELIGLELSSWNYTRRYLEGGTRSLGVPNLYAIMCEQDILWMWQLSDKGYLYTTAEVEQEDLLEYAAHYSVRVLKSLISDPGFLPSARILIAAFSNHKLSIPDLRTLLGVEGTSSHIDPQVIEAVGAQKGIHRPSGERIELIRMLLDIKGEHVGSDIVAAITAAANYSEGESLVQLLLDRLDDDIKLPPKTLVRAVTGFAGPRMMRLLLSRECKGTGVPDYVFLAVLQEHHGPNMTMLSFLLDQERVNLTSEVLIAAVTVPEACEVTHLICQTRPHEVASLLVDDEIWFEAARWRGQKVVDQLLQVCDDPPCDLKSYIAGQELCLAARNGNLEEVKRYLSQGSRVDAKDLHGETPLHAAARSGHIEVVRYLLQTGNSDVNAKDDFGRSALHSTLDAYPFYGNQELMLSVLLCAGAFPDIVDDVGMSSIQLAQEGGKGRKSIVKLLQFYAIKKRQSISSTLWLSAVEQAKEKAKLPKQASGNESTSERQESSTEVDDADKSELFQLSD